MTTLLNVIITLVISVAVPLGILEIKESKPAPITLSPDEIRRLVTVRAEEILKLEEEKLGTQLAALVTYSLSGAGVSSSATSITLSSLTLPQTSQKLLATDLATGGDVFYITLEPGSRTRQEIVSCTSVTQNAVTATLGGCTRGLAPISPYTASTSLQFAHGGGTSVAFSDPPQVFNRFADQTGNAYISGEWSFPNGFVGFASSVPYLTSAPTYSSSTQLATKGYVDGVAIAGAPDASFVAKGLLEAAELFEIGTGTPNGDGDTSAFLALTTNFSTSTAPFRLDGDATTSRTYILTTNGEGVFDNMGIATATKYAYRWGGLITIGEQDNNFQGFGVGTSSPGTWNTLAVEGNALLTGTTTTGNLVATSTLRSLDDTICNATTCFPISNISATVNELETINSSFSAVSGIATTTSDMLFNSNTSAVFSLLTIPQRFDIAKLSISVSNVGTAGSLNLGLYTVIDGAVTKVIDVNTGSITTAGAFSIATTSTTLNPGTYYFGVVPVGTADISLYGFTWGTAVDYLDDLHSISTEPLWSIKSTLTEASVLPDTFNETAEAAVEMPIFRFDN